jgi:UPF0755 protein
MQEKDSKDKTDNKENEILKYSGFYFFILKNYFCDNLKKITLPKGKKLYLLVTAVIIFLLWAFTFRIFFVRHNSDNLNPVTIQIHSGMNVSEIAQLLNDSNVISGTVWFKAAYKLYAGSETVKAGTYIFHDGMNNAEIIKMLTSEYLNPKGKITIPEGAKIKLIARLAEKELNLSPSEIISETQNDSLINILGLKGRVSNLEGFLYPDTYYLYKDVSEKTLVEMMFDEFVKKVLNNSDVNGAFEDNPGKLLEVITLASIVQAETGRIQEMPSIAGLYTNRLMKNMKLQADPTIQYVLPGGQRILLNKDYKFESPYNTYLHYGLPPGPVDNPGLDAIKAAVNPEKNDYLFMVADTNKTHRFAKTYQEHLKNISDIRNGGKQK